MTRTFPLADILCVTTGHLVSPRGIDAIYDVLNFMTGDNLMTHQLPRAQRECAPVLLAQHPQLADIKVPTFDGEAHVWRWLTEQVDQFGLELPVAPLDPADHTVIDPLVELKMMRPDMPVIAVNVDPS